MLSVQYNSKFCKKHRKETKIRIGYFYLLNKASTVIIKRIYFGQFTYERKTKCF